MDIKTFSVCFFDIEGTLIPVNFYNDVMVPYIQGKVASYIDIHGLEKETGNMLIQENEADVKKGLYHEKISKSNQILKPPAINYIQHILKTGKSCLALTMIQEKILKKGYESKEISWKIFKDVPKFLQFLKQYYIDIGTFSKYDVDSQIELFKNTNLGDMTQYISHYFDLKIGMKNDSESYINLSRTIKTQPKKITFITGTIAAADAAKKAGFRTIVVKRLGSKAHGLHLHESITDFYSLIS